MYSDESLPMGPPWPDVERLIRSADTDRPRDVRGRAILRKNFLFCGSDAGGVRAAAFYSLLGTAKLNGLDPEIYVRRVLERISDHPINTIPELLPWNLAAPHDELA